VDKRLKLYYGDGYGLSVFSRPGEGTEVTAVMRRTLAPA
jgi:sensor histidine kinase YesM